MGLLIGLIQRRQLCMEKSNLSFQLLLITKGLSVAHKSADSLTQVGTDYEGDPLMSKQLQERQYKLKILEEKLAAQKAEIQTRIDEINVELQSVNDMIKNSVQEMFSYKVSSGG